jgi:muconolactone delta-isomerase
MQSGPKQSARLWVEGERTALRGDGMKYMITWKERSQGSAIEYEKAQQRILDVFRQWETPANFKIELFVIRVGDWDGYMLADCDDPVTVHKFCSMLPAFEFEARPVIPIEDAVRGELEVMAWRDSLKFD